MINKKAIRRKTKYADKEYFRHFVQNRRSRTVVILVQCSSVKSIFMFDPLQPYESQHASSPGPSPTPRVHSNSRPSSW